MWHFLLISIAYVLNRSIFPMWLNLPTFSPRFSRTILALCGFKDKPFFCWPSLGWKQATENNEFKAEVNREIQGSEMDETPFVFYFVFLFLNLFCFAWNLKWIDFNFTYTCLYMHILRILFDAFRSTLHIIIHTSFEGNSKCWQASSWTFLHRLGEGLEMIGGTNEKPSRSLRISAGFFDGPGSEVMLHKLKIQWQVTDFLHPRKLRWHWKIPNFQ